MDITAKKALFSQVRVAHRLLAAYYNRVHQLIRDVTGDERLGLEFFVWEPTKFDRPCRRTSNILDRWSWDLLPGVIAEYLFLQGSTEKPQQPGEWLLVLHVISDTVVFDEELEEELDATELSVSADDAHSVLRCYLVAPHQELDLYWADDIWAYLDDYPKCTESPERQCMDDDQQIYASAFEIHFEKLTDKNSADELVKKIIDYRDIVLPLATSD
tara:strand:- start:7555 stop:8199 length:645 start_codon:yes stop_codon:yes gene_type:complete